MVVAHVPLLCNFQEVLGSAWASQACKTPNSVNENLGTSNAKDESAAPKLYLSIVIVLVVLKNQPRSRLKLGLWLNLGCYGRQPA
jgi:hypothetical protein